MVDDGVTLLLTKVLPVSAIARPNGEIGRREGKHKDRRNRDVRVLPLREMFERQRRRIFCLLAGQDERWIG